MTPEQKEKIYSTFISWLAMPKETREVGCQSIEEFCVKMKIDKSLTAEFQARDEFTEDYNRAVYKWGMQKFPELLHGAHKRYVQSQSLNDLKIYKDIMTFYRNESKDNKKDTSENDGVLSELFMQTQ